MIPFIRNSLLPFKITGISLGNDITHIQLFKG